MSIQDRLHELGIVLPTIPLPQANYVPFRKMGNLVFLAGQTSSSADGTIYQGALQQETDIQKGYQAARLSAINLIAALSQACDGDLERVEGCFKVNGYVLAAPEFNAVPAVINGASDLFVAVFGEAGKHARTAIGVSVLPRQCSVEVEAVFLLKN